MGKYGLGRELAVAVIISKNRPVYVLVDGKESMVLFLREYGKKYSMSSITFL